MTFTRLADTNTAAPGDGQNFSSFDAPAISGDTVVFRGVTNDFRGVDDGIYGHSGSLYSIINQATPTPDPTGAFMGFGDPVISGNNVAFLASYAPNDHSLPTTGIMLYDGTGFTPVADLNTAAPDNGVNFAAIGAPAISGDTIVFRGETPNHLFNDDAVYGYNGGSLYTIANRATSTPDPTGAFFGFGNPAISGGNTAFLASYAPNDHSPTTTGIMTYDGATFTPVVDLNTIAPDYGVAFSKIGDPAISGDTVVFRGEVPMSLGKFTVTYDAIYSYGGGSLSTIIDRYTPTPDPTGLYMGFGDPAISGNDIAFLSFYARDDHSAPSLGLLISNDGLLEEIVKVGDLLDGMTLSGLDFSRNGIDGHSLAFTAFFDDGSSAVYRVDLAAAAAGVPEPGSLTLMVLALGGMIVLRRRRTCSTRASQFSSSRFPTGRGSLRQQYRNGLRAPA